MSTWKVDAGWEVAVASIKTLLDAAFDAATSPSAMLAIKDFVLLVCSALGTPVPHWSCQVAPQVYGMDCLHHSFGTKWLLHVRKPQPPQPNMQE